MISMFIVRAPWVDWNDNNNRHTHKEVRKQQSLIGQRLI